MIRPSTSRQEFPSDPEGHRLEIGRRETGEAMVGPDTVGQSQPFPPRPHLMASQEKPSAPLIDRAGSLCRMGDDLELLQEMAAMFIRDVPRLMMALRDALAAGDADETARAAHSIKGLASNFGAAPCMAAALAIEDPAKSGRLADLADRQTFLAEQVELLCAALRREILV